MVDFIICINNGIELFFREIKNWSGFGNEKVHALVYVRVRSMQHCWVVNPYRVINLLPHVDQC